MEENKKDITSFLCKATENLLEVTINSKSCTLNIFFSVNVSNIYFNYCSKTNDYRIAFIKTLFYLYANTEQRLEANKKTELTEEDFIKATDSELSEIMHAILANDHYVKSEYDKLQHGDVFERFYCAHKNSLDIPSQNMLELKQMVTNSMRTPPTRVFNSLVNTHGIIKNASFSKIFGKSPADIAAAFDFGNITDAFNSINTQYRNAFITDFPHIQSILAKIPKPTIDITPITTQFAEISASLRSSFKLLADSLEPVALALANVDFSMLTYISKWSEKHDHLVQFGWFYLHELPEKLIDEIFEKSSTHGKDEVNKIITSYFRKDRCAALKAIVSSWDFPACFSSRKHIFKEALHCHSRRLYNASTTMLTLHMEGVITDFAEITFGKSRFKATQALKDINNFVNNQLQESLTFDDDVIFRFVIKNIQKNLSENFEVANPELTTNNSRHKIAHGHVTVKETEVNSLRRFLYLNELFRTFSMIDNEIASNDNAKRLPKMCNIE